MTWETRAACRGLDGIGRELRRLFFAPAGERPESRVVRVTRAKAVCAGCPVLDQCRDASADEVFGVWAGMTASERGWRGRQYPRRAANGEITPEQRAARRVIDDRRSRPARRAS